jgi:hypothetical protein
MPCRKPYNPVTALYPILEKRACRIRRRLSEADKMAGQRPVAKFAAGQMAAAIWENEVTTRSGKKLTLLKASVERQFKDKDG